MYDKKIVNEIENLFRFSRSKIMVVYDTTFNLCKYFISPLLCKFTFFIEEPVFMHESKNESSHNQFFHAISNLIPLLGDKTMLFYNWQRRRIWKAIANKIPNSLVLRYWNHLFNNIRLCVRKHNGKQLDAKVYCNDCRELFKC